MSRILLIDDNADLLRVCAAALSRAGFDVETADDGAKGLKLVESGAFDLVVTDVLMPNTDGIEIIGKLRERFPETPVIAISGGGSFEAEECLRLCRQLGVARTLEKPVSIDDFLGAVRAELEGTT